MGQIKINNEIFGSNDASDIVYRDTTSVKKAIDDLYKNGGGSQVEVSAIQTEGTHIANVIINGKTTEIYAPKSGELGSLADIEITNPSEKQTLIYDDKKKKWINISLNESKEVGIALPEILQTKVNVTSFTLTEDNVYVFISFNASSGGSPTNGYNSIVSSTMEKIYFERNISVGNAERGSAAFGVFKGNIGDTLQINTQACCTKLIKTNEEFNIIGHDIANTPSDVAYIVKEYNKDTLDTNNHRYYVAMVSCSGNGGQTCSITCEDGKRTEIIQQANGESGYCLLDSFLVEKDTLHNIHLYAKSTTNNTSYPKAAGYFIGYFRCNDKKDENIQGGGISALPNNLLYMSEDSEDIDFGLSNDYNYNVYSLDEKVIGKWVDGKKIYQKTYNTNNISLDVSKENIENIINGFVCIENDEENQIPLIPIISGENDKVLCSNATSWNGYIHYAWKLFNGYNGDETGAWGVNGVGNSSINWVSYHFDKPIIPKKCLLKNYCIYTQNATIEFQFSKNGEDWVTLGGPYDAREYNIAGEEKYYEFENNETYSYFRFYVIGCLSQVNGFICVDCVQVYGFETKYKKTMSSDIITFESNNLVIDKPLNSMIKSVTIQYTKTTDLKDFIPTMTKNDEDFGIASLAATPYGGLVAYYAFDKNDSTVACGPTSGTSIDLTYTSKNKKCCPEKISVTYSNSGNKLEIYGITSTGTKELLQEDTLDSSKISKELLYSFKLNKYYTAFEFIVSGGSRTATPCLNNIRIQGDIKDI